jgi:hypothetical protein
MCTPGSATRSVRLEEMEREEQLQLERREAVLLQVL